jgi:hypothetical protein
MNYNSSDMSGFGTSFGYLMVVAVIGIFAFIG